MFVGVRVGVSVFVDVIDGVGGIVPVWVGVLVFVGVTVGVLVTVGEMVGVLVFVGVTEGVGVGVLVVVGVGVDWLVGVGVGMFAFVSSQRLILTPPYCTLAGAENVISVKGVLDWTKNLANPSVFTAVIVPLLILKLQPVH